MKSSLLQAGCAQPWARTGRKARQAKSARQLIRISSPGVRASCRRAGQDVFHGAVQFQPIAKRIPGTGNSRRTPCSGRSWSFWRMLTVYPGCVTLRVPYAFGNHVARHEPAQIGERTAAQDRIPAQTTLAVPFSDDARRARCGSAPRRVSSAGSAIWLRRNSAATRASNSRGRSGLTM